MILMTPTHHATYHLNIYHTFRFLKSVCPYLDIAHIKFSKYIISIAEISTLDPAKEPGGIHKMCQIVTKVSAWGGDTQN